MRHLFLRACLLTALLSLTLCADACTFNVGYFHQVTRLKGRVVGKSLPVFRFRWLRQMFSVSGAELEVYEYQGWHWKEDSKPLARIVANSAGEFEFAALKEGHYSIQVKGGGLAGWFDVEITNQVPPTERMTIDISPVSPDCSGGHQIEVEARKK